MEESLQGNEGKMFFRKNEEIMIINDDFLTTTLIPEETIDLIVTSPPYNVDISYESFKDNIPYEKYLEFTEKWLQKALKLMKNDGRMCLNIPLDKSKGRKEEGFQSVYVDIVNIAKNVGWKYFTTIIWNEQNISRRTAWGSWLSASAPYIISPIEVIVVLYKKRWKKIQNGVSDITKDEFIEWTNGVWNFQGENPERVHHPSPFPLELPKRCIKLFSFLGDVVLDPFVGSGTTLVACALLKRKGIGVEIEGKYCNIARERLIEETNILQKKLFEQGT